MNEAMKVPAAKLIERLPESHLDPVARAVATAPPDDEVATEQDRARYHGGQAWFAERGGNGIPMEDLLVEFGLKPE